jgi:hypothetical protein
VKNLKGVGIHRCLPLLQNRGKLVFLIFRNVDPQALTWLFLIHIVTNLERNAMHGIKIEH